MPELPLEIWKDRIENELKGLERLNVLEKDSIIKNEDTVEFIINIEALGFIKEMGEIKPKKAHQIYLKINRSFPYPGGIDFSWYSSIYHPNIHPVETFSKKPGTGYICLNVLKKWSRLSDLNTTVKALKMLVENPNPEDPLNYDVCLEATEFFKNNSMEELKKRYKFQPTEVDDDDDIVIVDD